MKFTGLIHNPALILILLLTGLCTCRKVELPPVNPGFVYLDGYSEIHSDYALISHDDNIVLCGNDNRGLFLLKIKKNGSIIWKKYIDFANRHGNFAIGVAEAQNHELFLCATTNSDNQWDILLVKTNENGDTLWSKTYGGTKSEEIRNITATSDGNILITSKTQSFGTDIYGDLYLLKVDTDGNVLWSEKYADNGEEIVYDVLETRDHDYLITCSKLVRGEEPQLYLFRVKADGTFVRKKSGISGAWAFSTLETQEGEFLTCGMLNNKVMLLKTDALGGTLWVKNYALDQGLSLTACDIVENKDKSYSLTGYLAESSLDLDLFILKIKNDGQQLFLNRFGDKDLREFGDKILKDTNDDNLILGRVISSKFFLTRLDVNGKFK